MADRRNIPKISTIEDLIKALGSFVLLKTNKTKYTPTEDYQPATKKYVDDNKSEGGSVASVNGFTGIVVLDADDLDDSLTTHKFATADIVNNSIIEYGSNANGVYIKYANGEMVCRNTISFASAAFTASGSIYYRSLGAVTFPAEFIAVPQVTANADFASVGAGRAGGVSVTGFNASAITSTSTARTVEFSYIAMGRWQA